MQRGRVRSGKKNHTDFASKWAHEVVTSRGTNMGAVTHKRTPVRLRNEALRFLAEAREVKNKKNVGHFSAS